MSQRKTPQPTRGPWRIEREVEGFEMSPNHVAITGPSWHALAEVVVGYDNGTPIPRGEANAALIAAAPELLHACEAALSRLAQIYAASEHRYDSTMDNDLAVIALRMALRKARTVETK
jgi:hypothetical protein